MTDGYDWYPRPPTPAPATGRMHTQLLDPLKDVTPGGRWAACHPNVLFLHGIVWQPDGMGLPLLELAEMGSLADALPGLLADAAVRRRGRGGLGLRLLAWSCLRWSWRRWARWLTRCLTCSPASGTARGA